MYRSNRPRRDDERGDRRGRSKRCTDDDRFPTLAGDDGVVGCYILILTRLLYLINIHLINIHLTHIFLHINSPVAQSFNHHAGDAPHCSLSSTHSLLLLLLALLLRRCLATGGRPPLLRLREPRLESSPRAAHPRRCTQLFYLLP